MYLDNITLLDRVVLIWNDWYSIVWDITFEESLNFDIVTSWQTSEKVYSQQIHHKDWQRFYYFSTSLPEGCLYEKENYIKVRYLRRLPLGLSEEKQSKLFIIHLNPVQRIT